MSRARQSFESRRKEFETHLDLIRRLETQFGSGAHPTGLHDVLSVMPQHQRILTAGLYLHLYNLVESTVSLLIEDVEKAVVSGSNDGTVRALSIELRRQWVRFLIRDDDGPGNAKRIAGAMRICAHLLDGEPLEFRLARSGGGNWDDRAIEALAEQLGLRLDVPDDVRAGVKRRVRNDMGSMALLKDLRNSLAHGSLSFGDCGQDHSVDDVDKVAHVTLEYLEAVIREFERFISRQEFFSA